MNPLVDLYIKQIKEGGGVQRIQRKVLEEYYLFTFPIIWYIVMKLFAEDFKILFNLLRLKVQIRLSRLETHHIFIKGFP